MNHLVVEQMFLVTETVLLRLRGWKNYFRGGVVPDGSDDYVKFENEE